jgi:acetylornithine deacetylase/succinyl-diaminopimelate desuccinylase-like protein
MVATKSLDIRREIARAIESNRDDLVALTLEMSSIQSPHAQEREVAKFAVDWLRRADIEAWLQPITEQSANAIGRIRGTGGGRSLILDAHLDTGHPLPPDAPARVRKIHGAWREEGLLFGWGLVNDKAQAAAFMIALRALIRLGIRLRGDLIFAGVAFETGAPSVGAAQGINYPGEGFGTWWLVNRGIVADYALIGETSGFGVVSVEAGMLGVLVSTSGRRVYTPRFRRGEGPDEHPSAIVRLARAVDVLEGWAAAYERSAATDSSAGRIVPKAQIVGISGGADVATARLDVRIVPGARPQEVARDIRASLDAAGVPAEVDLYQWSRGFEAKGAEPLIEAVHSAHRERFGIEPPRPPTAEISMWRDLNVFNEVGIPSICFGPPRQPEPYSDQGDRAVRIDDLVAATQIYALTAIDLCGVAS